MEDGYEVAEGLAGASLGHRDEVAAGEDDGPALGLDGRGLREVSGGLEDLLGEARLGEVRHGGKVEPGGRLPVPGPIPPRVALTFTSARV